jgi:hypothetical protein
MMRYLHGAAVAAAVTLLAFSAPVMAEGSGEPQASAAAQNPDDSWRVVLYPVYGWLPIARTKTRLPEVPAGGGGGGAPIFAEGTTSGDLNSAIMAAARVEKGRFSLEGGALYAGLSGEVTRPLVKINVDATLGELRAGYAMVPDLYLEAGGRYLGLNMKATIGDYPSRSWKPNMVTPVLGLTYRPLIAKHWRLVLHGDVGGVVTSDGTTAVLTARVEWQPLEHFLLTAGGSAMYLRTEGKLGGLDVRLEQTLYGPVLGFGIPF